MIATITDIQGDNELNQLLTLLLRYNGVVIAKTQGDVEAIVTARFDDKDDINGFDIEVNDLGHNIDWQ